ncbi:MAG: hypothetical protein JWQ49_5919 [Edaphobacter sp.]|nr:hypothetical protein [Edaphobacter sp.]
MTTYAGPSAGGQTLSNITNTNQYTNGCSDADTCYRGNYLSQSLPTTVLYSNGSPSVSTQTQVLYNSAVGKTSAVKEWDYGANFGGTPTRETDYDYTGTDVHQVTVARPRMVTLRMRQEHQGSRSMGRKMQAVLICRRSRDGSTLEVRP